MTFLFYINLLKGDERRKIEIDGRKVKKLLERREKEGSVEPIAINGTYKRKEGRDGKKKHQIQVSLKRVLVL